MSDLPRHRFIALLLLSLCLPASAQPVVSVFASAGDCESVEKHDQSAGGLFATRDAYVQIEPCAGPEFPPLIARAFALQDSINGVVRASASGNGRFNSTSAIASAQATAPIYFLPLPDPVPGVFVVDIAGSTSGQGNAGYGIDLFLPSGSFQEEVPATQGGIAVHRVYPFVVPPGGFVGSFRVFVAARATDGSADLGRSAHVWIEGAALDPSEPDGGLLGARPPAPGDVNFDGRVNALDLNIVRRHLGDTPAAWGAGDVTGDDRVDSADLRSVRLAMRAGSGAPATTSTSVLTPEPGPFSLLVAPALCLLRRRR